MKVSERAKKDKKPLLFGALGGFIAGLCCVGPVLLVGLGLSGVSFALSIGKYTQLFFSLGTAFLIIALAFHYKKQNCCNIAGLKQNWQQIVGTFLVMALMLIIIKYGLAPYVAQLVYR